MNRILSTILLLLLLSSLSLSVPSAPAYIEGCFSYASDGSCQACSYAYIKTNGKCARNNNETNDCCATYNADGSCAQCSPGLFYADPFCYRNLIQGCIQTQGNSCVACGAGFALVNGDCYTVIQNCQSYTNAGQCSNCVDGFKLVNSYCVPSPNPSNCALSNYYGCVQCSNGFFLTANLTCSPFQAGCLKYWQGKCLSCLTAFTLINGACVIDGCQTYSSTGCSKCQDGLSLDNGKCYLNNCAQIINNKCVACKDSFRLSANGCISEQSFSCKSCLSGFVFVNNKCVRKIFGCLSYNANNVCTSCSSPFQLAISGACQILGCSTYSDNGCTVCTPPFQPTNNVCAIANCESYTVDGCSACKSGFVVSNKQCVQADSNCLSFVNSKCTKCKDKFYLFNGLCNKKQRGCSYNENGVCTCVGNYVVGTQCKCVIIGCSSYDANDNCQSCLSPFTLNNGLCTINNCQSYNETCCQACVTGFSLSNGLCVASDPYCSAYSNNGICLSCRTGFVLNSNIGKCFKNIPNCAQWQNDRITCQACLSNFVLFGGQCKVSIPNCQAYASNAFLCSKCSTGFRVNGGQCAAVDPNCSGYVIQDLSEVCQSCVSGYYLSQGVCTKNQAGCVYTGSVCSSCVSGFTYDSSSKTCFIYGCTSYSVNGCLACKSPFTLKNNACVIDNCAAYCGEGCTACTNGFVVSNGFCVSSDINCAVFTGNKCSQCKPGFTLLNNRCIIRDTNCETYSNDGSCFKCISSCFFDEKKKCQPKQNGCVYEAGRCKYCNPPFIYNQVASSCLIRNCLETNSAGCSKCANPFILSKNKDCTLPNCRNMQENACVQCENGFHLKQGVFCVVNNPNCLYYDEDGNCQLCKAGLTLTSNAECSDLPSPCVKTSDGDKTRCVSCSAGYFLNRFYQCEKQDGKCAEYTNGVCSKCQGNFFLYQQICFPYTPGCVQYSGKDCTQCKSNYALKNGQCFGWNQQNIGLLGSGDNYNFSITPIDVRQSKYYIQNLSPASEIGKIYFSSSFDSSYQDASLSSLNEASGKGWKAATADGSQFIGVTITGEPATFYAIQLEGVEGNYISEFFLEYSVNGVDFIRVQNAFTVNASIANQMTTIYFTGIYAQAIRIRISKFQGWPACRIDFFYYDLIRFRKISNLKSLKYLQETINSNFVDRVDNQIYINQVYFFNPSASCASKDMCFTGLQLCEPRNINSLSLSFGNSPGAVTKLYLTYSIDGRSYNCYNACNPIPVTLNNGVFSLPLKLNAQGVRIYPTEYSGTPNFSPIFYYE